MLKWRELDHRPGAEVVYTWQEYPGARPRVWSITRMDKWLETAGLEIFHTDVDIKRAAQYRRDRGIENHRLDRLLASPEAAMKPITMLAMDGGNSHVLLDGHHRYFLFAAAEVPIIRLRILTEEQASQFEVEDAPWTEGSVLDPSAYSGL